MEKKYYKYFGWSGLAVLILCGLYWLAVITLLPDNCEGERGQFGDMFGALTALFTGLAFAGLIVTIILQTRELGMQRRELRNTRAEFRQQNQTLTLQRFENTFFSLISLHHQIVNSIDYSYYKRKKVMTRGMAIVERIQAGKDSETEKTTIVGRDVFRFLYKHRLKKDLLLVVNPEEVITRYLPHFQKIQTDFKHYFRNLYRIIKLVDETDFASSDKSLSPEQLHRIKYKYTSIIRSQLSPYELIWLFYNTLARVQNKTPDYNFYNLIVKYHLFKGFPTKELALAAHKNWYADGAFRIPGDPHSIDPFD